MTIYSRQDLLQFTPRSSTFVGVDSDGCVFDTMDIKQKQFFHGRIVQFWNLQKIERYVRRAAEFINLRSKWRGSNRFPALLRVFELLQEWPEAVRCGVDLPECSSLRAYIDSGLPLGNPSLQEEVERTGDPELTRVLAWSRSVSSAIATDMQPVPPFRWARKCLEKISGQSDMIVVSQTPEEALVREWREHSIESLPRIIAGQELGSKAEHLTMAAGGRYAANCTLMIGDSLNDLRAARETGTLFFPINPGEEEASWKLFLEKIYALFLDKRYAGKTQAGLIEQFQSMLPETPPWLQTPRQS